MKNVLDKLMVHSNDYVAAIDVEDDVVLAEIYQTTKALVGAGKVGYRGFEGIKNIKVVKKVKQLDESIFDKVVTVYNDDLNLKTLVRVTDNLGLVLIANVPSEKKDIFENLLENKAGIFDFWTLSSDKSGYVDLLFKVRKY